MYWPVLTGVMTPEGVDADAVRKLIYENFDMSLGTGLGKMKGRMFRIGHLGDCNDLTLMATLAGCEMGLRFAGIELEGQRRAGGDGLSDESRREARPEGGGMSAVFDADALARLFVEARAHRAKLDVLPEGARPQNADEAYAAQEATLRALNADIGGWKVGAKSHDGPIQGAPLPADGMHDSGARLSMNAFGKSGLELEVAFRLGRRFEPGSGPYVDEDVFAAIESVHAAIEVVASRFAAWPDVEKPGNSPTCRIMAR